MKKISVLGGVGILNCTVPYKTNPRGLEKFQTFFYWRLPLACWSFWPQPSLRWSHTQQWQTDLLPCWTTSWRPSLDQTGRVSKCPIWTSTASSLGRWWRRLLRFTSTWMIVKDSSRLSLVMADPIHQTCLHGLRKSCWRSVELTWLLCSLRLQPGWKLPAIVWLQRRNC